MNKAIKYGLTFILTSIIFCCMIIIIVCNAVNVAVTRDNFNNCIGKLNIKKVVEKSGESYNQVIENYANKTNLSEDDIEKVLNSNGYSSIVGNYMIGEDMLNLSDLFGQNSIESIKELDEIDELKDVTNNETLNSKLVTRQQIEDLFKELDIQYTDSDLAVFEKSLKEEVAPGVEKEVENTVNKGSSMFSFSSIVKRIKSVFSKKTINFCKVIIVLCIVGVVLLNLQYCKFFIPLITCSFVLCLISRVFYAITGSIPRIVGKEFIPAVEVFTNPLQEKFMTYFNIFLFATLILVILYLVMNLVINRTSYGDKIDLFGTNQTKDADDIEYNEFHHGKFADEVDFEPSFYEENELKDITFSNDVYVHEDK